MQKQVRDSNHKLEKLRKILKNYKNVLIAYSGGVDSTFLLKVAVDILGKKNVIAATAISQTYPKDDLSCAKKNIKQFGIKQLFLKTGEMSNKNFVRNIPDRCYWCKNELFGRLAELAKKYKIKIICDGTNYSDRDDYRPGMKAAEKWNVKHPLLESELSKNDIRLLSKKMKLPTWNKEASPCLASRFPYWYKITPEKLKKISDAENELKKLQLTNLRLRDYQDTARIEIDKNQLNRIFKNDMHKKIVAILSKYNYAYITLDLEGYRTGSLNKIIKKP
ncbi:MAG: ATP-dependent sacrificial sulfur transferase LarE [Elusimicrobia bacterium]|nr:ATP-dependent sacrificial sulfur transferase LarE [Elusimicrobiota bacterium]